MNKIYCNIWNESLQTWVAASEISAIKRKSSSSICSAIIAMVFAGQTAIAAEHITVDTTINNAGTSVTAADDIYLDGGGTFTVDITGSGSITTSTNPAPGGTSHVVIGRDAGTVATVNVESGGSIYVENKLFIGQGGGAGLLNIKNGGVVETNDGGSIGAVGGVGTSIVNVESGGILISRGYLYVGGDSTGILDIDGGTVTGTANGSGQGYWGVGVNNGSTGTLRVSNGGNLTLIGGATPLEIGVNGTGTAEVRSGGSVSVGSYVRVGAAAGNGVLTVSGAGSTLQTTGSGSFRVGYFSTTTGTGSGSGRAVIEDGGLVKVNGGAVSIGGGRTINATGTGFLVITGLNSKFESTGSSFEIGANFGEGHVTVADSGVLDVNSSAIINVATGANSNGGTLNIGAAKGENAAVAGTISQNNAINLGGQGELVFNHTGSGYVFASSIASAVAGDGAIYQENAGSTTILTADNSSFSGTVTINGGTLQLGNGGTTGSIGSADVTVNAGAYFNVNRTGNLTIAGDISGGGQLQQNGTGTTILTGANSYSGGTLVSAGVLQGNTTSLQGDITNNATLVFDQTTTGTYSGTLNGSGTLTKQGAGDLTLAANASTGQVNHNAGTLNINANRTLSVTNGMNMANGTTLGVDISSTPSVEVTGGGFTLAGNNTINITGYSPVTDTGTYTLVTTTGGVTGNFTTTVAGAHLHTYVDLDTYLIGSAWVDLTGNNILARLELVWNNNDPASAHGTFNILSGQSFDVGVDLADNTIASALGFGWNGQDLTKKGQGTLILDGINTYTGHTDVQDGKLIVGSTAAHNNAQIAGNVDIQNNAILGGHGLIKGTVTVHGGGTLAPGNSVGTLTVADAIFNSGSTFQVEANPDGSADRLVADSSLGGTGTVTINSGAGLDIIAGAGSWNPSTSYLIIDTDGGVTGQFDNVTSNLAFLTETVNYTIPNQVWLTLVRNDTGFGDLDGTYNQNNTGDGVESLGGGNEIYDTIIGMSREQALNAYDNLSGEIHGSVKSALLTNRYARDAINQHLSNGTVLRTKEPDTDHTLWISTWGYDGRLKNDGNAAQLDYHGWGFLAGADAYKNGPTTLGLALGYEQTDLKSGSNRHSDADLDMIHLFVYGRTSTGPIDIRGGIGYSWLNTDTIRHVNVGNIQSKNQASYDGHLIQAYVEGSHTFTLKKQTSVTPYLNLAYKHITTDNFTEEGSKAELHGHKSSDHLITTTAGVRGLWELNHKTGLYGELGWQYNMGDIAPREWLNFTGGSTYSVKGTEVDRNSAIIGLGANYQIQSNMSLNAGYEGQFGNQNRSHALKVQLQWHF